MAGRKIVLENGDIDTMNGTTEWLIERNQGNVWAEAVVLYMY